MPVGGLNFSEANIVPYIMFHDMRTLLPIEIDLNELNKYFDFNWYVVEYNPLNKTNPY